MKYFLLIKANKLPLCCLMIIFLFTSQLGFASPISNNSTTNWNKASGWTPTGVPNLLIWDGTQDVIVSHNKTAGNLTIKNGNSIRVTSGTVLTINGDLTLGNRSSIAVDAGAVLIITGSLLALNSPSSVIIDGTLNVGGNYSVQTSAVVHEHKGLVTVGGNLSVLGNTNIKILGGAVAITGKLTLGNNGVMSGCSGRVTYGSYDINSCGFSYLKCCSDKRGTGCSNTPPPAKGMDFSNCAAPPPCNSIGGTVTSNSTVCAGSNSGTINLIGYNGSINRWEKTTNDWGTTTIVSNTTNSLTYNNISSTTKYRAVVRDGACPEAISSEVTITVDAASAGGNISSNAAGCYGSNSGTLVLSGQVGNILRWEKSTNNWSSKSNISNTTLFQTYNNLTTTTQYRAKLKSGVCSNAISSAATITVDAESVGGTLSSNATVCSGINSDILALSGQVGDIVRWEKSTNNWTSKSNISNTTSSQAYDNLTATTQYRAILKSGVCSSAISNDVTITVDSESVGGTLSSNATVCSGENSGTLILSEQIGDVVRWEKSTNNWVSKTNINNTSPSQDYIDLTATTKYRAILQSGVCSEAISTEVTVTVNAESEGGTLSSSSTVCSGTNLGTLTLTGFTGSIVRWQKTTSTWSGKTNIPNTTTSHDYSALTETTKYRAILKSGVCSRAFSNVINITVDATSVGGVLSSDATVCSGENSGTLNLSGQTGDVVRWEKSTNNWVSKTNINNTSPSQDYMNLTATTKYRAILQSGVCSSSSSNEVTITVDAVSIGGTISSSATTVCSGENSGTLTLSGQTGDVVRWEKSTNNWVSKTDINNTLPSEEYKNLTATTKYRAILQSGVCSSSSSNELTITVDAISAGGTISSSVTTVCSGENSGTLSLSGQTGNVVRWEKSTNNWVSKTNINNTLLSEDYTNLTATTKYRAILQSGVCSSSSSNELTIMVDAESIGGTISSISSAVCSGENSGTLSLSGQTGDVVRWEKSTNNWVSKMDINNTLLSEDYKNLTATTKYRAIIQSGVCSSSSSNELTITVDAISVGGALSSSSTTVCSVENSGTLSLSGQTGDVVRWEKSTNNWVSKTNINNTLPSQDYIDLIATTKYRAILQSGVCSSSSSNELTITVDAPSIGGTISSNVTTVCSGENSGTLTLSGQTGDIVRWEKSTDNWVSKTNINNTLPSQDYINLTATAQYRAILQSGVCSISNSNELTITVDAISIGGAISSSNTTVCSGENSGTLSLIGQTGDIVRWEKSTNNWISKTNINNTLPSQDYTNLKATTQYRAILQSGVCSSSIATELAITVDVESVGGMVSSSTINVCSGENSGTLTLSGQTGNVVRWEKSTNNWVSKTDINNTLLSYDYENLTATTQYRAILQSGVCSSSIATELAIRVDAKSVGGTISSSAANVCSGKNSGTFSLTGQTGNVVRWEKSTNNWVSKTNINNNLPSQGYNNLTATTKFRAILQSGVCSSSSSNELTITVDSISIGGTISSNTTTVCSGENSGTLSLTGQTGNVIRWEKSMNNWVSKTDINNTLPSQDFINLIVTTQYRAILQSGVCSSSNSNELIITVDAESVGGTLNSSATNVCSGENSGTLNLISQTGDLIRWEKSTNNWVSKTDINNNLPSQDYTNLTATTQYRAILQSGVCSEKSSTELEVLVNTLPYVYLGRDTSICMENPFILSAGPNGSNYLWNDASIFETLRINKKGIYSVIVTDVNNCVSYDTISVDTFPSPKLNIQLNDTVLCLGDSVLLSVDPNFSNYVWMNNSSTSHQIIVKTANTYILKVFNSNDCFVADTAKVTVNNLPDLELGDSTQVCHYKDLYASVSEMNANYQWSTGEAIQTIQIINSGKYWVNVLDTNNCFRTDTIIVYDGPDLDINLGDDVTICSGGSLVLDAGPYTTEIWLGKDTASDFLVNSALNYDVLVINDEGCFGMDTVLVEVSSIPKVKIVEADSLKICEFSGEEIELSIQNDEGMQIEWTSGDESPNTYIYSAGQHIVSKMNQFNCVGTDTITIIPYCRPVTLTMPNFITPNGDGINDYHIPLESSSEDVQYVMSRIKLITYSVHNRWGVLIHYSEGELPSWNGNNYKSGKAASQGTYFWVLSYEDASGGNFKLNGFVTLSR